MWGWGRGLEGGQVDLVEEGVKRGVGSEVGEEEGGVYWIEGRDS